MASKPLTLQALWGPLELRRPRAPREDHTVSLWMCGREVEGLLREAMRDNPLAAWDLWDEANVGPPWPSTSDEAKVVALMQALQWGRLVLTRAGQAHSDDPTAAAWKAYDAFRSHFGPEFVVRRRTHRLVTRDNVASIRAEDDFDVVPVQQAMALIAEVAKTAGGALPQASVEVLVRSLVDMHRSAAEPAFVLLRAPLAEADRYVEAEDVITPAKLKQLAEKDWIEIRLVDEDGMPWSGPYELQLPGGEMRQGVADEDGVVRLDRIISGACEFSLTEIEAGAWRA